MSDDSPDAASAEDSSADVASADADENPAWGTAEASGDPLSPEPAPEPTPEPSRWRKVRSSPLWTVGVLAVTALVVLAGVWLVGVVRGDEGGAVELAAGARPVKVGQPAPEFSATSVDGQTVRLRDLRGRTVWLVFGATWCPQCRGEAATLQTVDTTRDDVVVIAVYVSETTSEVNAFVAGKGLDYVHIADVDSTLGSVYRADGLPRHVLVDAEGIVRRIDIGAVDLGTADARLDEVAGR